MATAESERLREAREGIPWKRWGPYLSERQWGTVREDYSSDGNAWNYLSHDQARSRAYRWGEDGLAGISDDKQTLCFAIALWNGVDPILKERLFGLTNSEGNHGEDVKEYYFYLDSTPTHSYMKFLYKYPQAAYPYPEVIEKNRSRTRTDFEYELLDTGVFDDDRYFDVFVEYAKADAEDILIRITAHNRGPAAAHLTLLPTLWFRNTWSAMDELPPQMSVAPGSGEVVKVEHERVGGTFVAPGAGRLMFTENETNAERIFGEKSRTPYVKDAFHRYVVDGDARALNPAARGSKAAALYELDVLPGAPAEVRLRLSLGPGASELGDDFDAIFAQRQRDADEFYDSITPSGVGREERAVMRQALAGMLWSKQYYAFDVSRWLHEHSAHPLFSSPLRDLRNAQWFHMVNDDVLSMPDKWEYPWFAAWDLAFHTLALGMVDHDFSRGQLELLLNELYLHPNGQVPAYEWNFSDVNPPVHAWATLFTHSVESAMGTESHDWLKDAFQKLLINFTWWVNRKDPTGRNVFEGGFLGLDNIGVFDRSAALPTGGHLEQADGTAWMALFSQNMLEIALELALKDPAYEGIALKFAEHFFWIAASMDHIGDRDDEMWDEADGFFYDMLRTPDGHATRLRVRSMVGLLPFCAATVLSAEHVEAFPDGLDRIRKFLARNPELTRTISPPTKFGVKDRRLMAILDERKLRRVLERMLDEGEFFSAHGIRSLSKFHLDHPYVFNVNGAEYRVTYLPAESDSGMFGGNSNWRGPIWMPVNMLILRALLQYYMYYGNDFKIECPTGSGVQMTLFEVAKELARRLTSIFTPDAEGRRPVYGGTKKFQEDPHWKHLVLFYEYFHGDNGAGLGASHQTGWTGLIARIIQMFGTITPEDVLEGGTRPFSRVLPPS